MTRVLDPTTNPHWSRFGLRYLYLRDFTGFCDAVGLRSCTPDELQEYEENGWLFPAARLVMPPEYARAYREAETDARLMTPDIDESLLPFHRLYQAIHFQLEPPHEQDLSHPIDRAWGTLPELVRPRDATFQPWDRYSATVRVHGDSVECNLAEHFYHYWQTYELYDVRRCEKGMYREDYPLPMRVLRQPADHMGTAQGFEALSRFQHLHRRQRHTFLSQFTRDEDQEIALADDEMETLRQLIHGHAEAVSQDLGMSSEDLYAFLNRLMQYHHAYERSERVKLAKTLEYDIWRTVELIEAVTGSPTQQIAARAGHAGGYRVPYLEVLFPNRRKEILEKCTRILTGLAKEEYNSRCASHAAQETDIQALVSFLETTEVSIFAYVVAEVNDAFYEKHSWRTSATFLALKSLASLPEELMRTIILHSGDTQLMNRYQRLRKHATLYSIACLLFQGRVQPIWSEYEKSNTYHSAADTSELSSKLTHLVRKTSAARGEAEYLGSTLAVATLLRNFTSHRMLEDGALFQGQYIASVRSIIGTLLLTWKVAQAQGWV